MAVLPVRIRTQFSQGSLQPCVQNAWGEAIQAEIVLRHDLSRMPAQFLVSRQVDSTCRAQFRKTCARVLANRGPILSEVEAEAEDLGWRVVNRDLVRKGQASTKAVLPFIVLPGPLERDATMEGITH